MGQLGKRLISSAVLVAVTIFTIFFTPHWFFFLVVEGFILLALNEFLMLAQKEGIAVHRVTGLVLGALIPFSIYFSADVVVLMFACLCLFVMHFHPQGRQHALISTAVTLFGIVYVSWFFSHLMKIRDLTQGPWWVFYTILLVKGGDAGAYFVGKNYGKTKLIEHISPNKSVEGAIGGFLTTLALSLISKIYLPETPLGHLLILGIVVGILSQLGDLSESLIKREAGVKDSGQIPGLGGILDVFDSLLLTIPFVYFYITSCHL